MIDLKFLRENPDLCANTSIYFSNTTAHDDNLDTI